jgi:cytochrome c biogenesis protein CcmG/thiol:disulfide interchange protein DsbE
MRLPNRTIVARVLKLAALAALSLGIFYLFGSNHAEFSHPVEPANRASMPDFQLPGLDGKIWKLSDHRGRVVLVNFWATWCPPCRMETPGLVDLANRYRGKGLEVVGISLDENGAEAVRPFVARYHVPYPVLLPDLNSSLASAIESLPTTLLVDRTGRVSKRYDGAVPEEVFRRDVERLLAEN